jgi:hypothetical protein
MREKQGDCDIQLGGGGAPAGDVDEAPARSHFLVAAHHGRARWPLRVLTLFFWKNRLKRDKEKQPMESRVESAE